MSEWWKEFLREDVSEESFTKEQNELFNKYEMGIEEQRLFQSIKKGKNLFLSTLLSDEEILWNIGVMGLKNTNSGGGGNDMRFYRRSVIERLQKFDEAEARYRWQSGEWDEASMRVLVEQWCVGQMVVVPEISALDGSPLIFTKEWYDHWPPRENQPDGFFEFRASVVYPLMARSICRAYPMATRKGLVSLADMKDFSWDKYDMDQKMRHSDIQALIPNKLRRMISLRPDDKMKQQLQDYSKIAKKYGFVMYDSLHDALHKESHLLPSQLPVFVGGTLQIDIKHCLRHLFHTEPKALHLMEQVWDQLQQSGHLLCPDHMKTHT